ncbi:hypothetical protein D7I46_07295 [Lactococcus allomyrinae]|uniref:Uncharacterized protein n=1 Tax=Lactococcus allomyrinae TaxID=2419773 RepID=A0A387BF71_9LACT|nr:hypothetical protein D7I46_07295 [Lactococcus allomyrinae]
MEEQLIVKFIQEHQQEVEDNQEEIVQLPPIMVISTVKQTLPLFLCRERLILIIFTFTVRQIPTSVIHMLMHKQA